MTAVVIGVVVFGFVVSLFLGALVLWAAIEETRDEERRGGPVLYLNGVSLPSTAKPEPLAPERDKPA